MSGYETRRRERLARERQSRSAIDEIATVALGVAVGQALVPVVSDVVGSVSDAFSGGGGDFGGGGSSSDW